MLKIFRKKKKTGNLKVDTQKSRKTIPEMEALTSNLIQETVGDNGVLDKHFKDMVRHFDLNRNPLGVKEAEEIIFSLLKMAIAQRKLLAGRIECSVEDGALFERYYGKMQLINQLYAETYQKKKDQDLLYDKYIQDAALYKKVTGKTYSEDFAPSKAEIEEMLAKLRNQESQSIDDITADESIDNSEEENLNET